MMLCGTDFIERMAGNVMIIHDDIIGDSELTLYLNDISNYGRSNNEFSIKLLDADSNKVVCEETRTIDDYDYSDTITICNSKHDLKPGHYRLVMEGMLPKNGSPLLLPRNGKAPLFHIKGDISSMDFTVARDGKHLTHPAITAAKGKRKDKSLHITLACDSFDAKDDLISMQCFNSSLTLMATNDMTACGTGMRTMKMTLNTHLHWCDGQYYGIISHNLQPFACIAITINKGIISCIESCQDSSLFDYVRIGNAPWRDNLNWDLLTKLIAQPNLKRKAVECMKWNRINDIRSEKNLPKIGRNHNHVLLGDGGKEQVAMAEIFAKIDQDHASTKAWDAADICPKRNGQTTNNGDDQDFFDDNGYYTYVLYNTAALTIGNGTETAERMIRKIEKDNCHIILAITKYEWNMMKDTLPDLCRLFDPENIIDTAAYCTNDLMHVAIEMMKKKELTVTSEAADKLRMAMDMNACNSSKCYDTARNMVSKSIMPRVMERWIRTDSSDSTVRAEDIDIPSEKHNDSEYEKTMAQLNAMTGLKEVKDALNAEFNKLKLSRMRESMGLAPLQTGSHHMVFTGNPGTGKTTVARMMGRILKSLGVLTVGDVVMAERKSIIGQFIGDTEENMKALLQRAKGNVLFIDEAYTLCSDSSDKKDYGHRAIECLLTVMAQKDADMVVIMAGYEKDMERMMNFNEGLKGRFSHWIRFEDYTANELHDIGMHLLDSMQITMTADADSMFKQCISQTVDGKDSLFANARWVEQFVQSGIMPMMADRIISRCHHDINAHTLQTVTRADVERAFAMTKPKRNEERRRIGFNSHPYA